MTDPLPLETAEPPPKRAGLALPLSVFVDPARAFALVLATREWLPAYLILVVLGLAEVYLVAPALTHLVVTDPRAAASSAATAAQQASTDLVIQAAWGVVGPLILWGFVATLLAATAIAGRGGLGTYALYFSLCLNCALPAELGSLLYAAAIRLRDPATFHSANDFATALPLSLAVLHPHGSPPEIAFLSYWDVFTMWSLVLLGCGYAAIAKMRLVPALLLVLGIGLMLALVHVDSGT